jgi:hypothetical protein
VNQNKFHYRVHKNPPLVTILSHISPVQTTPSSLTSILKLPTHPPTSWSSLWLSHQYPICMPLLPIPTTFSSNPPWHYLLIILGKRV